MKYTRTLQDGSTEIYSLSNGAVTFPRYVFLTSVTDAQGNTTTLNYDGTFRLTSVTDAMGRNTTFTYGLASAPLLITKITDPFSRTSQITYDSTGRLNSITDPIGITSSFTYLPSQPSFVNTLTTPYGTSTFSDLVNPYDVSQTNSRSLTLTDPLGNTDLLYYYDPSTASGVDPNPLPPGVPYAGNGTLNTRTTYYWDRHAFPLAVTKNSCGEINSENFSDSLMVHFAADQWNYNTVGREIQAVKPALEWWTYLNYPTPTRTYQGGILDHPNYVGHMMSSTVQQLTKVTYNGGLPATVTDPLGRVNQYTYAANNIDLLTVAQETNTTGPVFTTVATYGSYNTQHEPQTYTGPDGQTWNYTYTAAGQIATIKDPNLNTTTYNYDASNRLSTVVNANTQTVLTLTYDAADRIATRKDSEGYILTYSYDNLDRVTKITYPDSTTDLYDYTFQSGPLIGTPSLDLRNIQTGSAARRLMPMTPTAV